jgi:O-antigen/teichoic acid export membrane protein
MTSVQHRMARGAAWMFSARWLDKILGLVSTLVLARLLAPEDFGLVAIATAFIALLTLLTNFSFDVALIQHRDPTREHYDTVWTLGALFGTALGLALALLSVPLAAFYNEPRLNSVVLVLAVSAFVGSLRNVGCVDFLRDLHFHKEFMLNLVRRLVTLPISIGLAFWLRSYWALVIGTLLTSVIDTALTYAMHPFRPRWSLARKGELFAFSKWLFVNNLLWFVSQRAGDFIIGKLRGAHDLGLFSLANELGSLPATELVAPINRAAFPGYSRLASDRPELIRTYLRVIGIVAFVALPAGVGISVTAPLIVPLLLGSQWLDAIPLMQFLAIAGAFMALWANTHYVLLALGKPHKVTILAAVQAGTTVIFLIAFLLLDIPSGIGWAMLAAAMTTAVPNLYLWRTELSIPWRLALLSLWRPALGSVTMASAVIALRGALGPLDSTGAELVALAICVVAGAVIYVAVVLAAWWLSARPIGAESFVLDTARKVLAKLRFKAS